MRAFVDRANAANLLRDRMSTPDLVVRIKSGPMVLPARIAAVAGYGRIIRERVAAFADAYKRYFAENDARQQRQAHHARSRCRG